MAHDEDRADDLSGVSSVSRSSIMHDVAGTKRIQDEDPESELNVLRREVRRLQTAVRSAQLQVAAQQDELIELRAENDAAAAREADLLARLAMERNSVRRTMAAAEALVANLRALDAVREEDDGNNSENVRDGHDDDDDVNHDDEGSEEKGTFHVSAIQPHENETQVRKRACENVDDFEGTTHAPSSALSDTITGAVLHVDPGSQLEMSTVDEPEYVRSLRRKRLGSSSGNIPSTCSNCSDCKDDTDRILLHPRSGSSVNRTLPKASSCCAADLDSYSIPNSQLERPEVEEPKCIANLRQPRMSSDARESTGSYSGNEARSVCPFLATDSVFSLKEDNLHDFLVDDRASPASSVSMDGNEPTDASLALPRGTTENSLLSMKDVKRADSAPLLRRGQDGSHSARRASTTRLPARPKPVLVVPSRSTSSQSSQSTFIVHSPSKNVAGFGRSELATNPTSLASAVGVAQVRRESASEMEGSLLDDKPTGCLPSKFEFSVADAHDGDIFSLCCTPDSSIIASGGDDRKVCLYDPKARKTCCLLSECNRAVTSLAFEAEGHLLAGGSHDGFLRFWRKEKRRRGKWALDVVIPGHSGPVRKVFFDKKASTAAPRLFSASADRSVKLTDITVCKRLFVANSSSAIFDMDIQEGSSVLLTGHRDGGLRMWSPRDGNKTIGDAAKVHSRAVTSVCCLENGYGVITLGRDGYLKFFDIRSLGEVVRELDGNIQTVSDWHKASLAGRHVACGMNVSGTVGIWNIDSGKMVRKLASPPRSPSGDVLELFQPSAGFVVVPIWTIDGLVAAHKSKQISLWS